MTAHIYRSPVAGTGMEGDPYRPAVADLVSGNGSATFEILSYTDPLEGTGRPVGTVACIVRVDAPDPLHTTIMLMPGVEALTTGSGLDTELGTGEMERLKASLGGGPMDPSPRTRRELIHEVVRGMSTSASTAEIDSLLGPAKGRDG